VIWRRLNDLKLGSSDVRPSPDDHVFAGPAEMDAKDVGVQMFISEHVADEARAVPVLVAHLHADDEQGPSPLVWTWQSDVDGLRTEFECLPEPDLVSV